MYDNMNNMFKLRTKIVTSRIIGKGYRYLVILNYWAY